MRRHPKPLLAVLSVCAVLAVTAPAFAQIDPGELASLERRRDALTVDLGELDSELEVLGLEIAEIETEIDEQRVAVELIADEIEWTAWSREEPAATRVEIAIVGFTKGDPRQNEMLNEVRTLEGDDEPSRRRALYESVIDDTVHRLEVIDAQLRDLATDLASARSELEEQTSALTRVREERDALGAERSEVATELAEIVQRIADLRTLENRAVLTGLSTFDDPTRPALAVKLDNVPSARPQAGINQADMVYIEEVEGGLTRMAAVFHSQGAEVVGPVRSMRTGDIDLLSQLNGPLFANSGGNRGSRAALASSSLIDVGVNALNQFYYRESGRRAPHNLFTNAFNLWSVGRDLDGAGTPSPFFLFRTAAQGLPPGATPTSSVAVDYGATRVEYTWNGSGWDRSQDGDPTVDSENQRVAPTTVVVQFVDYVASAADASSPEAVTVGEGTAWVLSDGHLIEGRWQRPGAADQTVIRDPDTGNEIPILPGRIWVELPRPGRASSS